MHATKGFQSKRPKTPQDHCILAETQADVGKRLGGNIRHQSSAGLGHVSSQRHTPRKQSRNNLGGGIRLSQRQNGQQRPSKRPNKRMQRVIGTVDPWHLIREELQHVKSSGDRDHPGITQHGQIMKAGRQNNPPKLNSHSRNENG